VDRGDDKASFGVGGARRRARGDDEGARGAKRGDVSRRGTRRLGRDEASAVTREGVERGRTSFERARVIVRRAKDARERERATRAVERFRI